MVFAKVKKTGVIVQNAPVLDGIGEYLEDVVAISKEDIPDPVDVLKKTKAEILICYPCQPTCGCWAATFSKTSVHTHHLSE